MTDKSQSPGQRPKVTGRQVENIDLSPDDDNAKVPDSEIQGVPKTRHAEAMKQGERIARKTAR